MAFTRIMYIERKEGDIGFARIGRVKFSKSRKSIYYRDLELLSVSSRGIKGNYLDVERQIEYWVSGCRKDGNDTLFGGIVHIDDDVREEYWRSIRNAPHRSDESKFRAPGKR